MAGIETEESFLHDGLIDLGARRGVGVNGLNLTDCQVGEATIHVELSTPFTWNRPAVLAFRPAAPNQQYRVYINEHEAGVWPGKELQKGIPVTVERTSK